MTSPAAAISSSKSCPASVRSAELPVLTAPAESSGRPNAPEVALHRDPKAKERLNTNGRAPILQG